MMHMVRIFIIPVVCFIMATLQACHGGTVAGGRKAEKIYAVTTISLAAIKTNPPQLQIIVNGKVRTSGWTNPQLKQFVYIQPPLDGIYDFDFVAVPPSGPALQVISDISVKHTMASVPVGLKGVRIRAMSNMKEALLETGN